MAVKKQSHSIEQTEVPNIGVVTRGKELSHEVFGDGVIEDIAQWESGDVTVGVKFEKHGLKWLVPQYAILKVKKGSSSIFSKFFGKQT